MSAKRLAIASTVLSSLAVVGACGDDSPSTTTVDGPAPTAGTGMTQASTEGNVGDITGNDDLKAEGKKEQGVSGVKKVGENIKDKLK